MTELTTSEVAALFDLDEKRIRKHVEHGIFEPMKSPPRFERAEVVYLFIEAGLGPELGNEIRKRLYELVRRGLSQKVRNFALSPYVTVELVLVNKEVEARVDEFAKWKKKLVEREDILGGEPVFPKTRLAVRQVGEMARGGAPIAEILEDYPYLSEKDVEFAKRFAAAYPRVGRPRVRKTPAR